MNNYNQANINYLRISVTDRCNFQCIYCRGLEDLELVSRADTLRYEEIEALARLFVGEGIRHIRITGGEPLIMKDIELLIQKLSQIDLLEDLSLTTNGLYLKEKAEVLKNAGLKRINVSLNSLNPATFKLIAGFAGLEDCLKGIEEAKGANLGVKLNTVLLKGINDAEILDFINFAVQENLDIRFIEYFLTNKNSDFYKEKRIDFTSLKRIIENNFGKLTEEPADKLKGPARYFRLADYKIRIGFINSATECFCHKCNRLRLTSTGLLYPCLHSNYAVDLKTPLRASQNNELCQKIKYVLNTKCNFNKYSDRREFNMSTIGG